MTHKIRIFLAAMIAVSGAAICVPVFTQGAAPAASDWNIGDVFAGVGRYNVHAGQFLVFNADGTRKLVTNPYGSATPETLIDPSGGGRGITTSCAIAPSSMGDALLTTSFFNMRVSRFEPAHPHTSSTAARIKAAPVDAAESIVFDRAGNYYVGGEGPAPQSALDPVQPYGYIVKFSSRNTWLATYEVPNGRSGANWIDLGSDGQTLYYTSEDETIHVYRPGRPRGAADDPIHRYVPGEDFYREIPIMQGSVHVQGTMYGVRVLPPIPGDPTLQPSGFLVAQYWRVLRLDAEGQIVQQYADDAPGSYMPVSVTPDARSFWTAKIGGGACSENGNSGGKSSRNDCGTTDGTGTLLKFDIATGDLTRGPIQTGTENVWGLCLKREYSAATNTCYALDSNGNSVPGPGGPRQIPCMPPPTCGAESAGDPLCAPRPPVLSNPGIATMYVGQPSAITFEVTAPSRNFYQVTTTGLPAGVQVPAEVGPALRYSFDVRGTPAIAGTYPSQICMSNPLLAAPVCQAFTVKVVQPRLP